MPRFAPLLVVLAVLLAPLAAAVPGYASASQDCRVLGAPAGVPTCAAEQAGSISVVCDAVQCSVIFDHAATATSMTYGVHRFATTYKIDAFGSSSTGLLCYAHDWSYGGSCDVDRTISIPRTFPCTVQVTLTTLLEETSFAAYRVSTTAQWRAC